MTNRFVNPQATIPYMQKLYMHKIDYFISRKQVIESHPLTSSGREEILFCEEKIAHFRGKLAGVPSGVDISRLYQPS